MLIKIGDKLYEEYELQEQFPLEDVEAQEEFNFAEANPELLEKLRHLNAVRCQTMWERIASHIIVE